MEQRFCRWCLSPVQPAARRCPHCTAAQTGWGHPSIHVAASVVLPLVFVGVMYFWILRPSTEFPEDGSALVVTSSSFHYEPFARSPGFVTCIGKLRNHSSVAWEHPQIEVQYFDRDGDLIDTITDAAFDLRIQPGQEIAFRVWGRAARFGDSYASHSLTVRNAKDAEHPF